MKIIISILIMFLLTGCDYISFPNFSGITFPNFTNQTTTVNNQKNLDYLYSKVDTLKVTNTLSCKKEIDELVNIVINLDKELFNSIDHEKINRVFELQREYNSMQHIKASNLLISEIYNGENNNQYLEIFNGTGNLMDIKGYEINLYNESNEKVSSAQFTNSQIENNTTITISNPKASNNIVSNSDISHIIGSFNKGYVIELKDNNGNVIDSSIVPNLGEVQFRNKNVFNPKKIFDKNEWVITNMLSLGSLGKHEFYPKNDSIFKTIEINDTKLNVNEKVNLLNHINILDTNNNLIEIKEVITLNDFKNNALGKEKYYAILVDNYNNMYYFINEFNIVDELSPIIALKPGAQTEFLINSDINILDLLNITDNFDKDITPDMIKIESNIDNKNIGVYEVVIEVKDSNNNISKSTIEISIVESLYKHEKISDVGFYDGLFPSTGSPKLLVIPIGFKDYEASDTLLNKINIAFNGTNNDLSYESLNTYYYKSSYQKLNVKSDILDWYKPKHSHNYYNSLEDGGTVLLEEACEYYNTTVDFTKYDYNDDDYIDGVYIIYNVPVDYVGNSLWWAYQYSSSKKMRLDGKILYNYAFAGTDFMDEKVSFGDINSRAYIHEFGHMLGLDDLYDYNEKTGPNGGLGGSDMMDHNIGDHNPFSKMALGWVKPTIVSTSGTYNLSSFVESGNVLLIHNNFNTIYDEYLLVEFYTPTSLNRIDLPMGNSIGVRILHVDARFNYDKNGNIVYNGGKYYSPYLYDNSDTEYKFMKVIEADFNNSIGKNQSFNTSDLFTPNSKVFGIYQKNYWNHQNENWNYIIEVISMNEKECVINIEM